MAGFAKTAAGVAAGILLAALALGGLALASAVVYHNYLDVPNYVLAAGPGEAAVGAKDAKSQEPTTMEPGAEVDFVTASGDDLVVKYHSGEFQDLRFVVPKRNLRSYATGKPLSP
jgi:hypothetical protein